jgi:hypothetical protein
LIPHTLVAIKPPGRALLRRFSDVFNIFSMKFLTGILLPTIISPELPKSLESEPLSPQRGRQRKESTP